VIAVVDFGAGNTRSVLRALRAVGGEAELACSAGDLAGAERLVLPGVGAAGSAMTTLRGQGLIDPLRDWVAADRPFLGICLGAQLMLDASEEDDAEGLGLLRGVCRRFPPASAGGPGRVPHIGWNLVELRGGNDFEAYFVHGYWLDPADPAVVAGWTGIDGFRFPSLLRAGSMLGTQFHPEKSGPPGRALLHAWVDGLLDNVRVTEEAASWT
jgi:imidazole glycerol phosphate synthase glutamine amidotransferase subunit